MTRRRSIPPRTMRDVWKAEKALREGEGLGRIHVAVQPRVVKTPSRQEAKVNFKGKVYQRPREWKYITKPFFRKIISEPIVDVFKEAEEIQIIVDLRNFRRGDIQCDVKGDRYVISGRHQDCEFHEEIALPENVDIQGIKKSFRNNLLELMIPRKGK